MSLTATVVLIAGWIVGGSLLALYVGPLLNRLGDDDD